MQKGIDFVGVSVVYFCHNGKGKFLMHKRGAQARDEQGKWDIGAGGLEFEDEDAVSRLKSEIQEEYGTRVISHEFLGFRDVHRVNEAGVKTHWLTLDFKVLVDPQRVKNGEPHKFDEVGWFGFDNLPTPRHTQVDKFFKKYAQQLQSQ